MTALDGWESFYVIVGGAAAVLVGLQFVVMTLIAERPPARSGVAAAGAAFASPTVTHFEAALLLAALLRMPWEVIHTAALAWGLLGLGGVLYTINVGRRMRQQSVYQPEFEDWLFHLLLPLLAYAVLAVTAFLAPAHTRAALFWVGPASLLLLFIGIHNAWDAVVYHMLVHRGGEA